MGFRLYEDENSEDTVLEGADGELIKLPYDSDQDKYAVPRDVLEQLVAARCEVTEPTEQVEETEKPDTEPTEGP